MSAAVYTQTTMVCSTVYRTVYMVHKRFTRKCVQNAHASWLCAPQSFCEIELCDKAAQWRTCEASSTSSNTLQRKFLAWASIIVLHVALLWAHYVRFEIGSIYIVHFERHHPSTKLNFRLFHIGVGLPTLLPHPKAMLGPEHFFLNHVDGHRNIAWKGNGEKTCKPIIWS